MHHLKKYHLKILIILYLGCLIFIGLRLRFRSYEYFPAIASTFDEQVVVWAGSSLINTSIPTSWSFIDDYLTENKDHLVKIDGWSISYDYIKPGLQNLRSFPIPLSHKTEMELDTGYRSHFTMVQPQIEQPPLGPLLSSFLSGSYKLNTFSDVRLSQIRVPVIYLSVFSMILVFLISYLSYGLKTALISSTLYTFIPTLIISQRLAVSENYLTFFILLGVLSNQLWLKTLNTKYLVLNTLLIVICYLIKPFGLALAMVTGLSVYAFAKPVYYLIYPVIGTVISMILFYLYGSFYSAELFQKVVSYQSHRFTAPLQALFKILLPKITNIFLDGWIVFSWIATFSILAPNDIRKHFWVLSPIISMLFFFSIYGGEDYGWYRLLLYPFLTIAAGYVLTEALEHINPFINILFLIIVVSTNLWWGFYGVDWHPLANILRISGLVFLGIFTIGFIQKPIYKKINQITLALLIVGSLWLSVQTINNTQKFYPTLSDQTSIIPFRK